MGKGLVAALVATVLGLGVVIGLLLSRGGDGSEFSQEQLDEMKRRAQYYCSMIVNDSIYSDAMENCVEQEFESSKTQARNGHYDFVTAD